MTASRLSQSCRSYLSLSVDLSPGYVCFVHCFSWAIIFTWMMGSEPCGKGREFVVFGKLTDSGLLSDKLNILSLYLTSLEEGPKWP